jgi:CheY-like chemotaxis protein
MMQSGIVSEGDFEKGLSIVSRNAHGLKYLINDLLDMSAILSGKIRLNESYISLEKVLAEAVETMRSYASETLVRLVLEIEPAGEDAFMVKGDRARLNQCFCNVLHNAVKFSPPGSETRIQCEASESQVAVTISDQGQGIPPEFLPHVFERFRQADASRTRAYGGLGLGLALVKSFVSAHGGTIEANSGGKGKGSTFVMHFPHAALAGIENAGAKQLQDSGKKLGCTRLLIVEDQSDTLEMLCEQFRSRGYETVPCTSATEALNLAGHERFDLLISDIAMPGMDGFELIKALRKEKQLEKFPAIALTGYASPRDAEAAIAAGFNLHLSKPIEPTELFAAVESLLHPD